MAEFSRFTIRRVFIDNGPGLFGWSDTSTPIESLEAGIAAMDAPMGKGCFMVEVWDYENPKRPTLRGRRKRHKKTGKTVERVVY